MELYVSAGHEGLEEIDFNPKIINWPQSGHNFVSLFVQWVRMIRKKQI